MSSLTRALSESLESQQVGPWNSWASAGQVLRVGLDNHGAGSSRGRMADVFITDPDRSSGHSRMDGIGYVSEHQPAGPLQWALRGECGLQRDSQGH